MMRILQLVHNSSAKFIMSPSSTLDVKQTRAIVFDPISFRSLAKVKHFDVLPANSKTYCRRFEAYSLLLCSLECAKGFPRCRFPLQIPPGAIPAHRRFPAS